LNTDELLDSFLDATRAEVDKARRQILDEANVNIRNATAQVNGSIQKTTANFDLVFKKTQAKLQEQESAFQADLRNHKQETVNQTKRLFAASAETTERLRTIEQRLDALTAPKEAPKLENIVSADGKVDLEPLFMQLQAQMMAASDLSGRVKAIEERDTVSPAAAAALAEAVAHQDKKLSGLEVQQTSTELRFSELKETLEELKRNQRSPEEDAKYQELRDLSRSLEDETGKLRDAMVKLNKDMISCRAAINTLRAHSEDAASAMEDIRKIAEGVRDDTRSTDKRLKKVVVFVQNETKDLAGQIKDLQSSIDRNANRIEEIAQQKQTVERIIQQAPAPAPAQLPVSPERPPERRPLSPASPKQPLAPLPPVPTLAAAPTPPAPTTAAATSPHLQLPEFVPAPPGGAERPPSAQVIQLPTQIVYEQPVVTIVKKQIDQVEPAARAPKLPRVKVTPSQASRPPSEVTRADLKKYDDLFARLEKFEAAFVAIRAAIDTLTKTTKTLQDVKADKDQLQALFDQFRLAMGELNNRIGSLRKAIMQKADVSELQVLRADVTRDLHAQGETAAGTEAVRCLLCGNPKHGISQAIPLDEIGPRTHQPGISSRIHGVDGQGASCFVYSETGEMFFGRSPDGKPIILKNVLAPASPGPRSGTAREETAATEDVHE
jgi:hypothetical protein